MIRLTIVKIEYNSSVKPSYKLWIDDKAFIPRQEKWINAMCQPLECILEKNGSWQGLLEELLRICNDTAIQIILSGEEQSYSRVKQFVQDNNFPATIKVFYLSDENDIKVQDEQLHQKEVNKKT